MAKGAVITADIANYTSLHKPDQKKLINILSLIAKKNTIEFYRGDGFQIYLKHPNEALKLLLRLRTAAKTVKQSFIMPVADIRASIGIGQVNKPIKELRTATAEAFILSGRSFDSMIKSQEQLIIRSDIPSLNSSFKIIAYFIDYLMHRLTVKQAEVVSELLNNRTQIEAARTLRKSQATINQHARAAGWEEIKKLLNEYEQLTSQFS